MYKVGEKVVYPHHGAGTVVKKETREVLGEKREYLTIQILHNDMTVNVPADNAEIVGVRDVVGQEGHQRVEVGGLVRADELGHDRSLDPVVVGGPCVERVVQLGVGQRRARVGTRDERDALVAEDRVRDADRRAAGHLPGRPC